MLIMKTNKKLYVKRVIYTALVLMCVCFIFSQSALSAGESSQESGRILRLLNNIARWFGCENLFTDFFVRKLAHFSEFAVLSFFSFCMYNPVDPTTPSPTDTLTHTLSLTHPLAWGLGLGLA